MVQLNLPNNTAVLCVVLYMSATVWNILPDKYRNCLGLTVETFRKHLKAYLVETAFMTTA